MGAARPMSGGDLAGPAAAGAGAAPASLVRAVQTNCHIADARHAADLTLCNDLLQMRELFRRESSMPFGATLPRAEVGDWIAARERLWAEHEELGFEPLRLPGAPSTFDPFEVEPINERLEPLGLLYGAGLVGGRQPVFFLAQPMPAAGARACACSKRGANWRAA
jgi:hypothetical protein